jgi:hypothetical protein
VHDFYSDTKTKPTRAMREVVLTGEVGDEQMGEDPTTHSLCERVAELLGKEASVFLPSGTGSGHHFACGGQSDDFLLRKLRESAGGGEQREAEADIKHH